MRPKPFMKLLFSVCFMLAGITQVLAANALTTTVELPAVIHFLTPAGDDVEVGPGRYEVETAESWLKLVPEGQGRTEAVLLEAAVGTHDETVTTPTVRLEGEVEGEKKNPEIFHLAMLLSDGTGLEAVGTISGIRPRGLNLVFVSKLRKARTFAALPNISLPGPVGQTEAPPPRPKGQSVDCRPTLKVVGTVLGKRTPALAVFQDRLHLLAVDYYKFPMPATSALVNRADILHWIYENNSWGQSITIPGQSTKKGVGLRVFAGRLHMVHLGYESNDLWHSTYDGQQWTRNVNTGQKSKDTPALAVWNNELHMVHLGDSSNALWHSVNGGNGWSINVKIPSMVSDKAPTLGLVPNGPFSPRLHMVFQIEANLLPQTLWHTQYDGRQWRRAVRIPGALTKAAPILVSGYPDQLHLIHLGKSSDDLWHMLFGTNKANGDRIEWFDERRLLREKSEATVGVTLFQGCYHMVSNQGDKLMHMTFSPSQVHPTVR